ncbi:protein phosphatase 2C domain-containing protein [Flammeovirga sp. SJP92]|uniref:protein phosphatase 2C domain-containing protein n=1 Tax=Flammeovirga sp. SJP92 TaxID=1775430 RepID=UPI000787DD74|nr:protein phosphatase 2C domain-containing protein [Flammeovirga sp. SJP92]KXX71047.1 hypothetical protein AVL50_10620 [Flammeovirga sp. SJP92]
MIIQTFSKRGHFHDCNEDALYHFTFNERFIVNAVMDGCSSAIESHFASMLFKKILHKSCNRLMIRWKQSKKIEASVIGKELLHTFFTQVQLTQKLLQLNYDELASTLILNIIDTEHKSSTVYCSGDGVFAVDNKWQKVNQNNVPDFLCYHLQDRFQNWFDHHVLKVQNTFEQSVIISTDGIDSFDFEINYSTINYEEIKVLSSKCRHHDDISMVFFIF